MGQLVSRLIFNHFHLLVRPGGDTLLILPVSRGPCTLISTPRVFFQFSTAAGPVTFRAFLYKRIQLQIFVSPNWRLLDGQEIETPRVDASRCWHVEEARKKENTGGEDGEQGG